LLTLDSDKDEDKDDDRDEDMLIGLSLSAINTEKAAKASSLRKLLNDTFLNTPYRMPNDNG
jgi:hypothetical protein